MARGQVPGMSPQFISSSPTPPCAKASQRPTSPRSEPSTRSPAEVWITGIGFSAKAQAVIKRSARPTTGDSPLQRSNCHRLATCRLRWDSWLRHLRNQNNYPYVDPESTDIVQRLRHVCFTPESRHSSVRVRCPKSARSRRFALGNLQKISKSHTPAGFVHTL
jgi:hypothetical protein